MAFYEFRSTLKVFLWSLECIDNENIEFEKKFYTFNFLIFWTFLFSGQNSVTREENTCYSNKTFFMRSM